MSPTPRERAVLKLVNASGVRNGKINDTLNGLIRLSLRTNNYLNIEPTGTNSVVSWVPAGHHSLFSPPGPWRCGQKLLELKAGRQNRGVPASKLDIFVKISRSKS